MFCCHLLFVNLIESSFMIFGLHDVSRVQRNIFLLKKPQKLPIKSPKCLKLPINVNNSWNIPFFIVLAA